MGLLSFGGDVLGFAGGLLGNHAASEEARKQRDWAKAMSDTEMTRRVADLKNAGLNPMLAVGHLGGASNSGGAAARQENPLASGVALRQQRLLNQALIAKNSAEAGKAVAETTESNSRTAVNTERLREIVANIDYLGSSAAYNRLRGDTTRAETSLKEQEWIHKGIINPVNERYRELQEMILRLSMPMHSAESQAWSTDIGQNMRPWLKDVLQGVGGAGILINAGRSRRPIRSKK